MSHTLFVADVHLCAEEPATVAGFLRFLEGVAPDAEALYILGDLFEAWIGDDDPNPLHADVASALRALNIPCYFIHGNRDFLLGKRFARQANMILLPEERLLTLYGKRVLIMHGDTLCIDDRAYQQFRAKVHRPWLQKLFLALPLSVRQRIALTLRDGSKRANSSKDEVIMDVNPGAVVEAMQRNQAETLVHGHTHRPAVHELTVDGVPARRVVLGAWHEQGSMIKISADETALIQFPF